jgi:hypothetical protein
VTHHTLKSLDNRGGRLIALIQSESTSLQMKGSHSQEVTSTATTRFDVAGGWVVDGQMHDRYRVESPTQVARWTGAGQRQLSVARGALETNLQMQFTWKPVTAASKPIRPTATAHR